MRLLHRRLEHSATLALAFCHAHDITVRDITSYGPLVDWDETRETSEQAGLGSHGRLDELFEQMRANVSQQVGGVTSMHLPALQEQSLTPHIQALVLVDEAEAWSAAR